MSCFGNWSRLLGLSQPLQWILGNSGNSTEMQRCDSAWCDLSPYSITPLPRKKHGGDDDVSTCVYVIK